MNSRKTRFVLAAAIAAAILGYKALQPKPGDADAAPAAGAPAPVAAAKPVMLGKIPFTPCTLSSPMSKDSLEALCGTYAVPEDRAHPDGRTVTLNIAWLQPTANGEQQPDPVFFLAGGPGQSAVQSYPPLDPVFRDIRKQRSVLLIDQRGTGKSNLLACQSQDDDADTTFSPAAAAALARALEKARARHS
ncbi:MAG: alpha/beta fold hydrolase [Thermomonas sp.]